MVREFCIYLSFSVFGEADLFFYVIKVVVITVNSAAMIDNPVFLISLKAIQQFFFSVPFNKQRKTIRIDF